jgi:hypothetical protein
LIYRFSQRRREPAHMLALDRRHGRRFAVVNISVA